MNSRFPQRWTRADLDVDPVSRDAALEVFWEVESSGAEESEEDGRLHFKAFFPEFENPESLRRRLVEALHEHGVKPLNLTVESENFDPEDWLKRCRDVFRSFSIGTTYYIHPSWQKPSREFPVNIMMEPGHAFGTGTHESTQLALTALREPAVLARSVLDIGTGSGILSIAVRRLNARAKLVAVDDDRQACEMARENFHRNDLGDVALCCCGPESVQGRFDLVLANLTLELFQQVSEVLTPRVGGDLVLSGFTRDQGAAVLGCFDRHGSVLVIGEWELNGWLCYRLTL